MLSGFDGEQDFLPQERKSCKSILVDFPLGIPSQRNIKQLQTYDISTPQRRDRANVLGIKDWGLAVSQYSLRLISVAETRVDGLEQRTLSGL